MKCKNLIRKLGAAALGTILCLTALYTEPLTAEETAQTGTILYPLELKTSTEPAFPYAWDDEDDLQEYFSAKLPAMKQQNNAGESFAYSATAMLGAQMIRKGGLSTANYSENELLNAVYGSSGSSVAAKMGGTTALAAQAMQKWNTSSFPRLFDAYVFDRTTGAGNERAKYWIRNYGAVSMVIADFDSTNTARINSTYNTYTSENAYDAEDDGLKPDQTVTIIGWDDDYPAENFTSVSSNGAWLVRNSMGTGTAFGINTYFWLSYEDQGLRPETTAYVADMVSYLRSDNNNNYNESYHENRNITESTSYHAANIFTVNGQYETIDGVSFYYDPYALTPDGERDENKGTSQGTPTLASNAEIVIWQVGLDGKPLTNDPYCTVVQKNLYGAGLYTVPLTKSITLAKDAKYAVDIMLDRGAVAIEAGNLSYTVKKNSAGTEVAGTKEYENLAKPEVTMTSGESFYKIGSGSWTELNGTISDKKKNTEYYLDGEKWVDANEYFEKNHEADKAGTYLKNGFTYGNFCIHALTTSGSSASPYTLLNGSTGGNASMALVNEQERFYFVDRELKPAVTVKCNGTTLKEGTDYKLLYVDNYDAGNARIYAIGMGKYTGFLDTTFKILPVDLQGVERESAQGDLLAAQVTLNADEIEDLVYKREAYEPGVDEVTIRINKVYEKVSSAYYYVEYYDNINAGEDTAKVWVTAKPATKNYLNSSDQASFTIEPQDISVASITIDPEINPHTGLPVEPDFEVHWANYTLIKDEEYTYEYSNNIEAGNDATITVYGTNPDSEGRGNYTGSISKTFTIVAGEILEEHVILSEDTFYYNREEQKPEITVKIGSQILEEDRDYTVLWLNECINVGTKQVRIESIPPYSGEVTKEFVINPRDLSEDPVGVLTLVPDPEEYRYTYTGEPISPSHTVTWDGIALEKDTEYTVNDPDPEKDKNIGNKASLTITGTGNFTGSLTKGFTIYQGDLADAYVTISPQSYTENGYAIDPDREVQEGVSGSGIVVKLGDRTLVRGQDYVVSFTQNLRPGTVNVTIRGKSNYTGLLESSFTIVSANGGESSGNGDGDGSDSDIEPDPGDGTQPAGDETILVGGVSLTVEDSGVTIAKGQKANIKSSFTYTCKKYKAKSTNVATVTNKGVLGGKKSGDVIVIGYKKSGKKWAAVEAVKFHVDAPSFVSKTIQARQKGESMNMAFFLDSVSSPTKWTVSDKKTAKINRKTGVLKFKKNSGKVTVTAYFGSGKNASKVSVNVVLGKNKTAVVNDDPVRLASPEEAVWEDVTIEPSGLDQILVPSGYSYVDSAYNDELYIQIDVLGGNYQYTGKPVRPDVAVSLRNTDTDMDDYALREGIEFVITGYDNYVDAYENYTTDEYGDLEPVDPNPPTVWIKIYFSDGTVGEFKQYYEIHPFQMTDVTIVTEPKKFVVPAFSALPKPVPMVTATVSNYDSYGTLVKTTRNLSEGVDFEVEYVERGHTVTWPYAIMNKGIYSIHLTGINNYEGVNKICTVEVVDEAYGAKDLSGAKIIFNGGNVYTYDPVYGVVPNITVKLGGKTLKQDRDYYLQYSRYTDAGTARLTIMAVGYSIYTGSQSADYTILPLDLKKCRVRGIVKQIWRENVNGVTCESLRVSYGAQTLASGTDYTVHYINNANAGKATVTLNADGLNGNYKGTISKHFKIARKKIKLKEADLTITFLRGNNTVIVYDPFEIDAQRGEQPVVTGITDRTTGTQLAQFVDYKVTYKNFRARYRDPSFKKANPPTMIIQGIGNYKFKYTIHYLMQ